MDASYWQGRGKRSSPQEEFRLMTHFIPDTTRLGRTLRSQIDRPVVRERIARSAIEANECIDELIAVLAMEEHSLRGICTPDSLRESLLILHVFAITNASAQYHEAFSFRPPS